MKKEPVEKVLVIEGTDVSGGIGRVIERWREWHPDVSSQQ